MKIKKSTIKILYGICKAINNILGIPLILILDLSFLVAFNEKLWVPIGKLLLCFLYCLEIVFIIVEYPFVILFDKLQKILSKNIDTAQPTLTENETLQILFQRYFKE